MTIQPRSLPHQATQVRRIIGRGEEAGPVPTLAPMPPQQPMKKCGNCESMNEPSRTSCRNCFQPLGD